MHRRFPAVPLAAALLLAAVACAPSAHGHSLLGDPTPVGGQPPPTAAPPSAYSPPTSARTTLPATTTAAPTTTTTAAPAATRPYPVGWTLLDLHDPTRPTALTAGRHLPTYVFYPAVAPGGGAETSGAPGLGQSWPIVIFAGGYNTTLAAYHDVVHHLAAAGFVVAMPLFPLETAGGPLNENDLVNEPGDITFVLNQVVAAGAAPGLLHGVVDPGHVALVGHSDGGEAVLGAAYLPGQVDARAKVVVAGSAAGVLLGNHGASDVAHAVMVVQGTADTINPPAYGDRLYATTGSPKSYLQLIGAPHLEPWSTSDQWHGVVESAIVDWLDAWIPDPYSSSAAARLGHDANISGTSVISLG
jgi:predicted dienelactone hydrolase